MYEAFQLASLALILLSIWAVLDRPLRKTHSFLWMAAASTRLIPPKWFGAVSPCHPSSALKLPLVLPAFNTAQEQQAA